MLLAAAVAGGASLTCNPASATVGYDVATMPFTAISFPPNSVPVGTQQCLTCVQQKDLYSGANSACYFPSVAGFSKMQHVRSNEECQYLKNLQWYELCDSCYDVSADPGYAPKPPPTPPPRRRVLKTPLPTLARALRCRRV